MDNIRTLQEHKTSTQRQIRGKYREMREQGQRQANGGIYTGQYWII